jgi:predicted RNA-binding Zn-ribbon protein involved in translation (DUF1610 family)
VAAPAFIVATIGVIIVCAKLGPIAMCLETILFIGIGTFVEAWQRRKRRLERLQTFPRCRVCGYNLTGNHSDICPECGTIVRRVIQSADF